MNSFSNRHGLRERLWPSLSATLVYVILFYPGYRLFSQTVIALSIAPILIVANAFGAWGGFLSGLVSIPLNGILYLLAGEPDQTLIATPHFWIGHFTLIIVGTAVHVLPMLGLLLEDRYEAMSNSAKFLSVIGFLVIVGAWHVVSRRDRQRQLRRSLR